jgi:hypothetical protein
MVEVQMVSNQLEAVYTNYFLLKDAVKTDATMAAKATEMLVA